MIACKSAQDANIPQLKYTTKPAPEWDALFIRNEGWFGGDGVFSFPIAGTDKSGKGSKQMIIFSDTMLGEIKDSTLQKGYHMINNSVSYMDGIIPTSENISFPIPQDKEGNDLSIFPVQLSQMEKDEYYWLGDGMVNPDNGSTYIFAYRVIDRPEWHDSIKFKFEILGGAFIILEKSDQFPYKNQRQIPIPFFHASKGHITSFGAGVFENTNTGGAEHPDGYLYFYGIRDPNKQVLVARVKPKDLEHFDEWRFYDGEHWVSDFKEATAIADSASNELSVSLLPNGEYALISQLSGIYPTVTMRTGPSPWGPFGPMSDLWDCRDALLEPEFFTYNAKAHPTLSAPGELLVSYNVNSFAFWNQIEQHPHLYRPRFFKLIFEEN